MDLDTALKLYLVTDRHWLSDQKLIDVVEEALQSGVSMVQLREKNMSYEEMKEEALAIQALCKAYHVPFLINDNVTLAAEIGADGVHVGQSDLEAGEARAILGPDAIIGVTAKTIEQARAAEEAGATYLGSGAVFGTSTKADALPMSRKMLEEIVASVSIPVVAIGGITGDNVSELAGSGIAGVAVVSGILAAESIGEATRVLREKVDRL